MFGIDPVGIAEDTIDEFIQDTDQETKMMEIVLNPFLLQRKEYKEAYENHQEMMREKSEENKRKRQEKEAWAKMIKAIFKPWLLLKKKLKKEKEKKLDKRRLDMNCKDNYEEEEEVLIELKAEMERFVRVNGNKWKFGFLETKEEKQTIQGFFGTYNTLLMGTPDELKDKLSKCRLNLVFSRKFNEPHATGSRVAVTMDSSITQQDINDLLNYDEEKMLCGIQHSYDGRSGFISGNLFSLSFYNEHCHLDGWEEWAKTAIPAMTGETSVIDKVSNEHCNASFIVFRCVPLNIYGKWNELAWIGIVKKEENLGEKEEKMIASVRKHIQDGYEFHKKALELSKKVKMELSEKKFYGDSSSCHWEKGTFIIDDVEYQNKKYLAENDVPHYKGPGIDTVDGRAVVIATKGDKDIFDYNLLKW